MENIERIERLAPLEERIRDRLLVLIKQGEFGVAGQLPSESELASSLGVSRATVRAALSLLAAEGIVVRKHGSGTFVNHAMLRLRLEVGDQWEFQAMISGSGYRPGIRFIDSEICPAGAEVASALNIDPEETVLKIRKIFTANEKPAIYSINMFSSQIVSSPFDAEKLQGPIFPFLFEVCNVIPAYSVTDFSPVIADKNLAEFLAVEENSPLLLFKDVFYSTENKPILFAYNHFNNFLHFKAIRQPNTSII
jgi:DNA-binding GntR family transcriptional regulator